VCATISTQVLDVRQLQTNLSKSCQKSAELQARISDLQAHLEHSIDLTEAFSRESFCAADFIR
jgi:hypothetical protein